MLAYLHTGTRKSELFRLTWDDVDFQKKLLCLKTRKTEDGSWKIDLLPMTPELHAALLEWWENRPFKQTGYVFVVCEEGGFGCQYVGQPFKSRQHWLKKMCRKAGVRPFDFHAMRHLTATIMYHAGMPLAATQAVLRHENPNTTAKYLKRLGLTQAGAALEKAMNNRGPGKEVEFNKREATG